MIVGGSAASGAGVGGLLGGAKGAMVGAAIGGGAIPADGRAISHRDDWLPVLGNLNRADADRFADDLRVGGLQGRAY